MITALLEPTDTMPTPSPTRLAGIDRIVLTGFMGSGKTSTGSRLANHLGWRFLDLDHEIERRQALTKTSARTIPEIFAQHGEPHFRRLESAALVSLLGQRQAVIALGGGAPEELGNRLLLEQTPRTAVIYLAAPFDLLLARCNHQALDPTATARPNLADPAAAALRFKLRHPHYERIASHTLDTSALTLDQTPGAILDLLQRSR
jgi:shikimate kinase